jgi:hypothetical protein
MATVLYASLLSRNDVAWTNAAKVIMEITTTPIPDGSSGLHPCRGIAASPYNPYRVVVITVSYG